MANRLTNYMIYGKDGFLSPSINMGYHIENNPPMILTQFYEVNMNPLPQRPQPVSDLPKLHSPLPGCIIN